MNRRLHALVSGRVQGVSYRAFILREAQLQRVTGWVRNLADGRVELIAEGEAASAQALLLAARRGPPASKVDRIEEAWADTTNEFDGFVISADGI